MSNYYEFSQVWKLKDDLSTDTITDDAGQRYKIFVTPEGYGDFENYRHHVLLQGALEKVNDTDAMEFCTDRKFKLRGLALIKNQTELISHFVDLNRYKKHEGA